jgi:predicted secreted protein
MPEIVVDPAAAGGLVTAALGDTVVVRLDEIPTSGYRWQVDDVDPSILEGLGDDFKPSPAGGLGGGGQHEFRFLAVGTGDRCPLRLILRRAWDPDGNDAEVFDTTVVVTG